MTGEPTVQVPVSVIQTVRAAMDTPNLSWSTRQDIYRRLDALIAQPTPSARTQEQIEQEQAQFDDYRDAEPPRIEGMAPGTTFTAEMRGGPDSPLEWVVTPYGSVAVRLWTPGFNDRIDPSTIRDVTPPATGG